MQPKANIAMYLIAVGMAMVTIWVPLAIAIFFYQKQKSRVKNSVMYHYILLGKVCGKKTWWLNYEVAWIAMLLRKVCGNKKTWFVDYEIFWIAIFLFAVPGLLLCVKYVWVICIVLVRFVYGTKLWFRLLKRTYNLQA